MSWKEVPAPIVVRASGLPARWIYWNKEVGEALRENGFEISDGDCKTYTMNITSKFQGQYRDEIYQIIADVMGWEIDWQA